MVNQEIQSGLISIIESFDQLQRLFSHFFCLVWPRMGHGLQVWRDAPNLCRVLSDGAI